MNKNFIIKFFLSFVSILLLYLIIIQGLPFDPIYGQTLLDSNKIQVEGYVFRNQKSLGVVVGSSLVARLPHNKLLPDIYNLGMRGYSALTGLDVLVRSQYVPRVVFIEINTLYIDKNESFLNNIFGFPNYQIKTFIPAFRTQYQPANVWHSTLIEFNNARHASSKQNETSTRDDNTALFQKLLADMKGQMAILPDAGQLQQNISYLQILLDNLEQQGSIPIFVEMPIHPTLVDSPRQRKMRDAIQASFPPTKYHYLYPLKGQDISTTDGIHLDASSGKQVVKILRSKLAEKIQSNL